MKRFILPSVILTVFLLTFTSSALAKNGDDHKGGHKGGNNANGNNSKGSNGHRQGNGHHGGHGKHHSGHGHHGHHRHRPNWGFGLWAPPLYPYGGGYYQPYYGPRPMPPQPYMRPYGGYYRPGNFGFFFNF